MSDGLDFLLDTQKSAVAALEELIADIRRGDVIEFIGIAITANEKARYVGGQTIDRHRMAGMLMDLATERLRQSSDDEEED